MSIDKLISDSDKNSLISDNERNLNIMRKKFLLSENDIDVMIENVFTIYSIGVKYYKIEPEKHGGFLLLTMHNYYNFLMGCLNEKTKDKPTEKYKFTVNKISDESGKQYMKFLYKTRE